MDEKKAVIRIGDGTGFDQIIYPKTTIDQVEGLDERLETVEQKADRATRGKVFDTVSDMETWLSEPGNAETLNVGDNLYIRDNEEPDYWWDGVNAIASAAESVNLDLATSANNGLMSKEDFTKLEGIENGANNYEHQTVDGFKHLPTMPPLDSGNMLVSGSSASTGEAFWGGLEDIGAAAVNHSHDAGDLTVPTIYSGYVEPAGAKQGDIWFDFNNGVEEEPEE